MKYILVISTSRLYLSLCGAENSFKEKQKINALHFSDGGNLPNEEERLEVNALIITFYVSNMILLY